MKPRQTHLLFAALAVTALGIGVLALRYMPGAGKPRGPGGGRVATPGAAHPAGGAILPGLRRALPALALSTKESPAAAPTPAPAPETAAIAPLPGVEPPPEAPAPLEEPPAPTIAATPATQPPSAGQEGGPDKGIEGTISFPPVAPTPPGRPAELRSAETPLPPIRPRDLAALTPPETPAPPQQAAAQPTQPAAAQTPAPVVSAWSLPQWPQASPAAPVETPPAAAAPLYVDAPTPPTRPADLGKLAALAPARDAGSRDDGAQTAGQTAPASAEGAQVARLEEPTLRPAPEDAFQPPPPKFGMGDPVFVRIFKQEGQLELWLKKNGRYALYKTFPICKWSGRLGPKLKEADYQSPEGFYSVSAKQLNPHSNYYRAFNVGYPNAFDRQNGRTGGLVMVHGACKSVGCFAMTDRGIEEIYGFVEAAMRAGQKEVSVHIFPFRMTEANITREIGGGWLSFVGGGGSYAQWAGFWRNLKQGYDLFEQSGEPPVAFACGDHYEFDGGSSACRRVAGW